MKVRYWFLLTILFSWTLHAQVQDSVVPVVEELQREQVTKEKLSSTQQRAIERVLPEMDKKVRIMSYNMLYNGKEERLEEVHHWKYRKERIAELIEFIKPDLIGTQELLPNQVQSLSPLIPDYEFLSIQEELMPDYGHLDGIFYRKNRLQLIDKKFLFASATPLIPSDNPFGRRDVITQATFELRGTMDRFIVLNVHASYYHADSREYLGRFLAQYVEKLPKNLPLFVMGDFNTFPFRGDLHTVPFYDGDLFQRIMTAGCLLDARDSTILGSAGPLATFTNDPQAREVKAFTGTGTPGVFLDHIYYSRATILNFAVEPARVNGHFPSDHMPIFVDVLLQADDDLFVASTNF